MVKIVFFYHSPLPIRKPVVVGQQFLRHYHHAPKHRESGKQALFAFLYCYDIYPD
ncbi:MAG TPA: hypothetical protein PK239_09285 [Chitinophagales bacterium]|nr:hypothetical protein [Chitinophagales bacterium]